MIKAKKEKTIHFSNVNRAMMLEIRLDAVNEKLPLSGFIEYIFDIYNTAPDEIKQKYINMEKRYFNENRTMIFRTLVEAKYHILYKKEAIKNELTLTDVLEKVYYMFKDLNKSR